MPSEIDVTFYDHLLPGSGEAVDASAPLPSATQFALDPSSVRAFFPPSSAAGDFSRVLPHITLDRAILPWERELRFAQREARAPWLALLVFAEGELPDDPAADGMAITRSVADLPGTPAPGVLGPDLILDQLPPETAAGDCRTIDVPAALFTAVMPLEDELAYLAHVRGVRQPRTRETREQGEILTEGQYAVVAANRFPRTTGRYAVHLVSLEGHESWLGGTLPSGVDRVRLCSLYAWSFTNDPAGMTDPETLLAKLATSTVAEPDALTLALRPPRDGDGGPQDGYVRERLALGYVPVQHNVTSGESTFAWYRGPFTPVTAPSSPPPPEARYTTADHALIYEADHGVFDVSYAAAWTLGRALALADPDYSGQVIAARRELANHATSMMALAADAAGAGGAPGLGALRELCATRVRDLLAAPLAEGLGRAAAPPRLSRADARASLLEGERVAALADTARRCAGSMPEWLDRLALLHGVPFHYLVPDPGMLPPESLRLFRIDPAWIGALLDGATSLALHTSLDRQLDDTLRRAVAGERSGGTVPGGVLIRSALVQECPGLLVRPYRGESDSRVPIAVLRRDTLGPDVLLVLFEQVPDTVELAEPPEGLSFGIDMNDRINLRQLTPGTTPPLSAPLEQVFPAEGTVTGRFLRTGTAAEGVLHLLGSGGLLPALATALDLAELRPGQFALELVNAPRRQLLRLANN